MVDASKKKEMKAKETIRQLDMEREKMSSLLVKGAGLSLEHESTIGSLTQARDELQARLADSKEENQRQLDSIQVLQEQIEAQRERMKTQNETVAKLQDNLSDSVKAEKRELRRKERMEKELRDVREKLDAKTDSHDHVQTQLGEMEYKKKNLDIKLKDANGQIEKHKRDLKQALEKLKSLHVEKDEQIRKNEVLRVENQRIETELLNRDKEINKTRDEKENLRKKLGYEKKKVGRLENFRAEEKMERDMLQEQINHLNKEIVSLKKDIEMKQKSINELHRANDVTEKLLRRAEDLSREQTEKVGIGERANRRLQGELVSAEKDVRIEGTNRSIMFFDIFHAFFFLSILCNITSLHHFSHVLSIMLFSPLHVSFHIPFFHISSHFFFSFNFFLSSKSLTRSLRYENKKRWFTNSKKQGSEWVLRLLN